MFASGLLPIAANMPDRLFGGLLTAGVCPSGGLLSVGLLSSGWLLKHPSICRRFSVVAAADVLPLSV